MSFILRRSTSEQQKLDFANFWMVLRSSPHVHFSLFTSSFLPFEIISSPYLIFHLTYIFPPMSIILCFAFRWSFSHWRKLCFHERGNSDSLVVEWLQFFLCFQEFLPKHSHTIFIFMKSSWQMKLNCLSLISRAC